MSRPTRDLTLRITDANVRIYDGDRLLADTSALNAEGRDDLEARVRAANAAAALVRMVAGVAKECERSDRWSWEDHNYSTPEKKQAAWGRGMIDGLAGRTVPYPGGGGIIPDVPPEGGHSYSKGYEWGEALRRAALAAGGAA